MESQHCREPRSLWKGKEAQEARLRGWEGARSPALNEEVGFKAPSEGRSVPCSSWRPEYQHRGAISTQVHWT